MRLATSIFLALFLMLDGALIYGVQKKVDQERDSRAAVQELARLPKGEYLKVASLGYSSLVADLIWLKIIQVMADRNIPPENAEWIYHALDTATDLDKKFDYVYEAGGVFLSAVSHDFENSNQILKKGFYNNPDNWKLPFYIGVNYFLYLNNYKQAAYYIGRAAVLPGRPEFVPLLATRLYAEAGDPRFAIELIENIYRQTKDEKVKASLLERMKELVIEANIQRVEEARDKYTAEFHKAPVSVETLVSPGYLMDFPTDPLNGKYSIDSSTGEVKSNKLPKRLKIFKR